MTTLVFPVSTPDGRAYLDAALARDEAVVCASCDVRDPTEGRAPWRRLPLVSDATFAPAYDELVRAFGVTKVYAAAHMVHAALADMRSAARPRIVNASPLEREAVRWDDIFRRAERWRDIIGALAPDAPTPDASFIAGVIRLAFDLFGESYDDKLAAMLACLASSPDGDIVEIGALFGRSASVLLAGRNLGEAQRRLFVFDPWSADIGAQQDLPEALRVHTRATPFETIVRAFEATFSAIAPAGSFAAFRVPSALGQSWYRGQTDIASQRLAPHLPPITPAGRIALLHIDGNHDFTFANEDIALWSPLVARGGWVVIDDYCWRYGDGPRRAGDALLARWGDEAARAFVIGDCLFVQRAR